jgi:hypothetical protein
MPIQKLKEFLDSHNIKYVVISPLGRVYGPSQPFIKRRRGPLAKSNRND